MSRNLSQDHINNRFVKTITETIKQVKDQRTNQFILPAPIAPTLLNSWVNYGVPYANAGYYIDQNGKVHLLGVVKSGTVTAVIFTLPAGYRPSASRLFPIVSNGAFGYVTIDTSGNVTASAGSNVLFSLDGVSFRTT